MIIFDKYCFKTCLLCHIFVSEIKVVFYKFKIFVQTLTKISMIKTSWEIDKFMINYGTIKQIIFFNLRKNEQIL
jgi:hypothetical protein